VGGGAGAGAAVVPRTHPHECVCFVAGRPTAIKTVKVLALLLVAHGALQAAGGDVGSTAKPTRWADAPEAGGQPRYT